MRKRTQQFLTKKITEATTLLLQQTTLAPEEPLEYYTDDIFQLTLEKCAAYFLEQGSLRKSEQYALRQLQKDIREQVDVSIIEKRLINNLRKIKPVWGEFFGTDRGRVYNTFRALKAWPCFTWHTRLYYKEQRLHKAGRQTDTQSRILSGQQSQLSAAGQLIQRHEDATDALSQRAASQFVTIQRLRQELTTAKKTIEQLEEQLNAKNTDETGASSVLG